MICKPYIAMAGTAIFTTNAMAMEPLQSESMGAYSFSSYLLAERLDSSEYLTIDPSIDSFSKSKPGLLAQYQDSLYLNKRSPFKYNDNSDPAIPRNKITFGYAFNHAGYTRLYGRLSYGSFTVLDTGASQDMDAYYSYQGSSNINNNALMLDYKITDHTNIALVHTYHEFFRSEHSFANTAQSGIYIGTRF
ncbi:hypothetical protein AB833_11040 [Chromatiales bacterium (ex Bugula neritina AB1)]|nr:hypothetical protein AB833_11040 [Chromatiales bacterium (ex Bugula neritina AB1)]